MCSVQYILCVGGSDYLAQTGRGRQKSLSPSNRQSSYLITLVDDGIVLEENETFSLQLQKINGQQPVAAFQDAIVTITDGDGEDHVITESV